MKQGDPTPERAAYNVGDVSALLGISKNRCYDLVAEGAIPSIRLGGRIIIPVPAFESWLAAAGRTQTTEG